MAVKVGISGFGRIARVMVRAAVDMPDIEICGINVRNMILHSVASRENWEDMKTVFL